MKSIYDNPTAVDFFRDLGRFINPTVSVYKNRYGIRINKTLRRNKMKKAIKRFVSNNKLKIAFVAGFAFDYLCSLYWF